MKKFRILLNKILDFISNSPFESEDEYLYTDLNRKIQQIKENNYSFLINNKLKPYIAHRFYIDTGMLMPEKQIEELAYSIVQAGIDQGKIDDFYNVINN